MNKITVTPFPDGSISIRMDVTAVAVFAAAIGTVATVNEPALHAQFQKCFGGDFKSAAKMLVHLGEACMDASTDGAQAVSSERLQ